MKRKLIIVICLFLTLFGCNNNSKNNIGMSEQEYREFSDECWKELSAKQDILIADYNIKDHDRYEVDQSLEIIQLKKDNVVLCEFKIIIIGSWSPVEKSWMWAWANNSITASLRTKAIKLMELENLTNDYLFGIESFEADEDLTLRLSAMALHHLDGLGLYVGELGNLYVYLILMEVNN